MRATIIVKGIGLALAITATPALARQENRAGYPAYPASYMPPVQAAFPVDRALAERCGLGAGSVRQHMLPAAYYDDRGGGRGDGLEGALIGGVVGGLLGNRVAGRGDRTVGSVAGAAVGAIAGAAIDRARDEGRAPPPGYDTPVAYEDECDAVLPPGYMLVSVPGGQECRDEVVTREEWVPEYVTIPNRTTIQRAPPRNRRARPRLGN
ncbi:MAG: glycine zipper 2TM domain-containing protein [Novosphingobium sp.]|nr:glycine zipper 2TM domain-containing protein [Novosphingobium sp.]